MKQYRILNKAVALYITIIGALLLVPCMVTANQDFGELVSVYQGAQYTDALSSVAYLGQGIVVAGKRSWNLFFPNIAFYRSTDYGLTWNTVPNPSGITGNHVYFFGQHESRVFAGTGDTGNVCLMRSDDYGATWSVVLTTAALRTLAGTSDDTKVGAVFSPVYMGNNRWLVNLRNDETAVYFLESLDNGDTWHAFYSTGIDTSARKMILTSDGTLLYAGFIQNAGMYVSHDGGYSFSKTSSFLAFAGMADLGNGLYLDGTYEIGTSPITISIYKSSDYGQTWNLKKTVSLPTAVGYFRTIIKVADDLVIAYASCSEFSWTDRCAEAYASKDEGETWTDLGPAFVGPYGNMNAIYDTVLVKPGTFIATAQPDSNILRSNLPPLTICQNVTVSADGSCQSGASVDHGSYDPDGDSMTCVQTPSEPYSFGSTIVTLTCTDTFGASSSCSGTVTVVDTTEPQVTIITPQLNIALQDGVTFQAQATDNCSVDKMYFYVREPDGGDGVPIGYEDLAATFNTVTGYWEYPFNTTVLQDGYYVILAKAIDKCGNEAWSQVTSFSIRNWAVITLLPSTPNNKAGRTMPVKFSIRIAASVDPAMPFVYNEDLAIRIYRCDNSSCSSKTLKQNSTYGTGTTDYRINGELYITNFKTDRTPAQYLVEIWRPSNNFLVGSFTFKTVK